MSGLRVPLRTPIALGLGLSITRAGVAQAFAELNLLAPTLDPRISFTGGPVTYVGADGLLHTSAANEWPLEYDPVTLLPNGRSAWEQRTNLLLQSGAPATQGVSVTAQSYTLSFTGTGTVALSGAYVGSKTGTGSGPANRVSLTFTPTAGTLTVTPSGSVQSFQLEAAATPGPYIPTTNAQVTRAAQVSTVNDLSTLRFNAAAGTLYAESVVPSLDDPIRNTVAAFSGAAGERIQLAYTAPAKPAAITQAGGIVAMNASGAAATRRAIQRIAIAFSANGQTFAVAGGIVASQGASTLPSTSSLQLGQYNSSQFGGSAVLRRIRYYPRKLSDAELQALTA